LTGQIYVALEFFPDASNAKINWQGNPPELPTTAGMMQQFQASLIKMVARLEKVPLDQLAGDVHKSVQSLDATLKSADVLLKNIDATLLPEARRALEDSRSTLAGADKALIEVKKAMASDGQLQVDLRDTLQELGRAARSLRVLSDYLERNPEALLWGKKEDKR
jgi:paraquat-inducible protein B